MDLQRRCHEACTLEYLYLNQYLHCICVQWSFISGDGRLVRLYFFEAVPGRN